MIRFIALALAGGLVSLAGTPAQTPPKSNNPFDLPNTPSMKEDKEFAGVKKQLKDADPRTRLKAIEFLASKGEAAAPAAGALCDTILDSSPKVGAAALAAVEKVRPDLYKPLTALVVDKEVKHRLEGAKELGLIGEKALPAVNVLTATLRRELAQGPGDGGRLTDIQQELFNSIRQIKPDDTATVAIYKAIAGPTNKHAAARGEAFEFLHQWAGADDKRRKEVLPLVKSGVENDMCRVQCIRYLGEYGPLAKECLPRLKQLKLSSDATVRDAATASVDKIENP
jgi:hypothetical protein